MFLVDNPGLLQTLFLTLLLHNLFQVKVLLGIFDRNAPKRFTQNCRKVLRWICVRKNNKHFYLN